MYIIDSSFTSSEVKGVKELSLPTVAEELRQQSFWRIFLSSKTYGRIPEASAKLIGIS